MTVVYIKEVLQVHTGSSVTAEDWYVCLRGNDVLQSWPSGCIFTGISFLVLCMNCTESRRKDCESVKRQYHTFDDHSAPLLFPQTRDRWEHRYVTSCESRCQNREEEEVRRCRCNDTIKLTWWIINVFLIKWLCIEYRFVYPAIYRKYFRGTSAASTGTAYIISIKRQEMVEFLKRKEEI